MPVPARITPLSRGVTPGARWVDRYLVPRLAEVMPTRTLDGMRILHLEPDDAAEAHRCCELGAEVTLAALGPTAMASDALPVLTIGADGAIGAPDARFDVVLTGRLGRIAEAVADPAVCIAECARVCRGTGGMLATLSTGSPASMAGSACDRARAHGRITVGALERSFASVRMLPVQGHFGWTSGGRARRVIGAVLDAYWRNVASPAHPRIYGSPLNPLMIVWASRTRSHRDTPCPHPSTSPS